MTQLARPGDDGAGLRHGGTDGSVGSRTIQAIRAFQASRGLPQTGFAEPSVLAALR